MYITNDQTHEWAFSQSKHRGREGIVKRRYLCGDNGL